ncbi:heavy metal translocating P-type ATPase [Marinomonas mediterranea]|uniref:Copper-exporting P-type ATPase n=1 Tax=Marinomonas mediterranea (strain ATCC 700492 / JCM 21426 / NBRC 103028 / MMB-1) TaxID=717774 RepID=F2JTF7_MARM1|nr:heavy metal translocating P-type ATPase [Marinomonas mediterranea]ADZ91471.1 heavy metal translocating P-type ATPase [Marinomonas mediterranea MMB-1]WCN17580.1 heavy metal translocating P-type ATPase [Marinomonas mediterranea MMB-1]
MTSYTFELSLAKVSCGGCVRKIEAQLKNQDPNLEIEVTTTRDRAHITTVMKAAEVIEQITQLGYVADLITPNINDASDKKEDIKESKKDNKNDDKASNHPVIETRVAETNAIETDKSNAEESQARESLSELNLLLEGVTCASCVNTIEKALDKPEQIQSLNINFANRTAHLNTSLSNNEVIALIESAGYGASVLFDSERPNPENSASPEDQRAKRDAKEYNQKVTHSKLALALGIPLMLYGVLGGSMSVSTPTEQLIWFIVGVLTLFILVYAGKGYFTGAWKALKNCHANMDTLIALGTGTAWLYSMMVVVLPSAFPTGSAHLYFEASAMIIGLINLGQALELKARGKTSESIRRLLDLKVKTAQVVHHDKDVETAIERVAVGDRVRVRAGEKIPLDGRIDAGQTTINESMLTGEPIPIEKQTGDMVSAGTINEEGSFTFVVTKVGKETRLSQIVNLVEKAQNSKPPISHLADRISAVFVPTVMVLAIVTALVWYNVGIENNVAYMMVAATSVLIIACPCALGLATPISTMIGIGKAAEHGALIRNGESLQQASDIDVMLLDKTGTITQGKPKVVHYQSFSDRVSVLDYVAALEKGSTHPLAQALSQFSANSESWSSESQSREATALDITDFQTHTGMGVSGVLKGEGEGEGEGEVDADGIKQKRILLGNKAMMQHFNIAIEGDAVKYASAWQDEANTLVYFSIDNELTAMFGITDPIREDATSAIARFHRQGIHVVMLTGDNPQTAEAVAKQTGIDEFHANLMPDDKLAHIKAFQAKGRIVGMVGDGINDAPALAQANVGFAIGSGTDVAIESADITLLRSSLHSVSNVIALSSATMSNIKQNLMGAFLYNSLGIPIAAGLLFPMTGWLLSPIVAGLAMSLSSLTVVTNANRLRFYSPR